MSDNPYAGIPHYGVPTHRLTKAQHAERRRAYNLLSDDEKRDYRARVGREYAPSAQESRRASRIAAGLLPTAKEADIRAKIARHEAAIVRLRAKLN